MADDFDPEAEAPSPPETDLLGAPWCELRDPRGRRKLRFKPEVYDGVEAMKAGGMTDADIAKAVGVSKASAQRHFGPELENGFAKKRAELIALGMDKARAGSVSAMKFVWAILDKGEPQVPSVRPARPEKLGKKETLARDARELDLNSSWGRRLQ